MAPQAFLNVALPGAGLLIRGWLGLGLALLLAALVAGAALALIPLLAVSAAVPRSLVLPALAYIALGIAATALQAWLERPRRLDPELIRSRHRALASAWLTGRDQEALVAARALVAAAPTEPGAWRQLALVASGLGQASLARRAETRARRLASRRDES